MIISLSFRLETWNNTSVNFEEKILFTYLFFSFHSCFSFSLFGTFSTDTNKTSISTSHTHSSEDALFLLFISDFASLVDRFGLDDWKHWTLQLSCNSEFRFLKKWTFVSKISDWFWVKVTILKSYFIPCLIQFFLEFFNI